LGDAEEPQAVQEDGDVAAGDGERGRLLDEPRDLLALARDRGTIEGTDGLLEVLADLRGALDVMPVEGAARGEGVIALGIEEPAVSLGAHELAGRPLRVGETRPVDDLELAESLLAQTVGGGEGAVLREDLLASAVEHEVDRPRPQVVAQLRVLVLPLLPAGR